MREWLPAARGSTSLDYPHGQPISISIAACPIACPFSSVYIAISRISRCLIAVHQSLGIDLIAGGRSVGHKNRVAPKGAITQ
jgi:hypothetical protein